MLAPAPLARPGRRHSRSARADRLSFADGQPENHPVFAQNSPPSSAASFTVVSASVTSWIAGTSFIHSFVAQSPPLRPLLHAGYTVPVSDLTIQSMSASEAPGTMAWGLDPSRPDESPQYKCAPFQLPQSPTARNTPCCRRRASRASALIAPPENPGAAASTISTVTATRRRL